MSAEARGTHARDPGPQNHSDDDDDDEEADVWSRTAQMLMRSAMTKQTVWLCSNRSNQERLVLHRSQKEYEHQLNAALMNAAAKNSPTFFTFIPPESHNYPLRNVPGFD